MGVIVEACWKGYKQAGLKKKETEWFLTAFL